MFVPTNILSRAADQAGRVAFFVGLIALIVVAPASAGDILRGGATMSSSQNRAAASSNTGQDIAAQTKAAAQDRLARTAQALQSVTAMQNAARSMALSKINNLGRDPNHPGLQLPNVPNGLTVGGLDILGVPTGAKAPVQSGGKNGVTVTVRQTQQQALLNWKTFNIGRNTTLDFDQSAGKANKGQWIAFNKISDPSGSPSQILGSIKADGQVYVINQNGIIFGGTSQVNVHTLVASSLPINDNLITRGLLNNPDSQFLFSALPVAAGKTTAAFTPPASLAPNGMIGDVVVQAGADIEIPTTVDNVGGRAMLVGPNVTNAGTISTPDGQTILAAGLQVGVAGHASTDPSLRGLDVYVGSIGTYSASAANSGLIEAPRGSVTLTGKSVNQLGVIDSSTSVSLNGRIDLLANFDAISNPAFDASIPANGLPFLFKSTGSVTLGPGSVDRILPEILSPDQVVGTELALRSQVNIQGLTVHFASDAMLLAPNANIEVQAGKWHFTPSTTKPLAQFAFAGGQIYFDAGAFIDVSGTTDVSVPISQNIMSLELRGSELADSPLQRDQLLRGVGLTLDLRKTGVYNGRFWVGTPLGDATGFLGLIERTVAQLTTAGGSVNLQAGSSVVMQKGSAIDASGGWISYQGGLVKTTRVLYQGQLIDIANATPDRIYDGIYTGKFNNVHTKWGMINTYLNPLALSGVHYESGYIQGADGGSISIVAPSMALDGELTGQTVIGPRQMRNSATLSALPAASSLSLTFKSQDPSTELYSFYSPTPPRVVFENNVSQSAVNPFAVDAAGEPLALPADRRDEVILSPDLFTIGGFGKLSVDNSDGSIEVPQGVELLAPVGGSINLAGANVMIDGKVSAPSGSLSFTAFNISPYVAAILRVTQGAVTPPPNTGRGLFTLGSRAVLDVAGTIIDDRITSDTAFVSPISSNGGSITINSYSSDLQKGGTIDASGGVLLTAANKISYGDGGAIVIKAGQDPTLASVLGGELSLSSTLKGFAGGAGGSLTLQTSLIQIGGSTNLRDTLLLTSEFFNQGGFSHFTLNGLGAATGRVDEMVPGLLIAADTVIDPQPESLVALPYGPGMGGLMLKQMVKPIGSHSPVSLSFGALGVKDSFSNTQSVRGDLVMEEGASILPGPLGSVSLNGNTVAVFGSVIAPGGTITASGGLDSTKLFADQAHALATVYLGPNSVLSTAGTTLLTPDPFGRRTGTVLPGGVIFVSGNIVADKGAVLDVSGTSGILDLTPAQLGLNAQMTGSIDSAALVPMTSGLTMPLFVAQAVPAKVDSNGGTIILTGGQELFTNATLLGRAGGPTALGGNLVISSSRFSLGDAPINPTDVNLEVTQNRPDFSSFAGDSAIGHLVTDGGGNPLAQSGHFGVDDFLQGGFDALALNGVVKFTGPVSITARGSLTVATGGVLYADSAVKLTAPYVALGTPFLSPIPTQEQTPPFLLGGQAFHFLPTFGPGSLTVVARLIDIGNLSLQNIGQANFIAQNGEIRGDGTLDVAGEINLEAAQIYPATGVTFTIAASDFKVGGVTFPGSVNITGSGTLPLPLSAGGQLNVYGSIINQGGVLRAPLGSINLGWDGAGTAPVDPITGVAHAVSQQLTLSAGSVTSVSAIDPITGQGVLIPYGINLNGTSWIDPSGTDITANGVPQKSITLGAKNLSLDAGSTIDIRGGGDLYAYRFVPGLGGSKDILASTSSFAVIPGFGVDYAPYAPFNTTTASDVNLGGDPGYVNSGLKAGDRVYLGASSGMAAGIYTLLPARYALMPGAFLITPKTGAPMGTLAFPDGSSLVSGYRFNDLNTSRSVASIYSNFEVAPAAVVRSRAQFDDFTATSFLSQSAQALGLIPTRQPIDAGHLILQASQTMTLRGGVLAQGAVGGRGGLVDIASPIDILIGGSGTTAGPGVLFLNSSELSAFGAESLLIGGVRSLGVNGTTVTVTTNNLTVNNAGSPLSAPEIILVAKDNLTLAPGAEVIQSGTVVGNSDTLLLGNASVAGSGNGALLRVTSDSSAQIIRSGVTNIAGPNLVIGAGAQIAGSGITLDSTFASSLNPTATLDGNSISLDSGQISLQLDNPGALQPTVGLVLSGGALSDLESTRVLSLLSYSSIDIYGSGNFNASGRLAMHAAEIRGFNTGGGIATFDARTLVLDNSPGRTAPGIISAATGDLAFKADTIRIGANQLNVDQYNNLTLDASGGVFLQGSGGLKAQGNLTATTPFIAAMSQATQAITAGGALIIQAPVGGGSSPPAEALGASLTLQGSSVAVSSDILLPTGLLTLHATNGDVVVGGNLDVSGTLQRFFDLVKYTDGGQINLISDGGAVSVLAGSTISVAANSGGGNAGSLSIKTPSGNFSLAGTLEGKGGAGGQNGTFVLDVKDLPTTTSLDTLLNNADFTQSRSIRARTGDVLVNGDAKSQIYELSADGGSIAVSGTVDAPGLTGGEISLRASGSVTTLAGSLLTVAGQHFSDAGKGGEISLEAGSEINGSSSGTAMVDIQTGSTINLSVADNTPISSAQGDFTGVLHLRAPQIAGNTDLQIAAINGTITGASSILAEGYKIYDLTATGGTITSAIQTSVQTDGTTFAGNTVAMTARLLANNASLDSVLSIQPGAEIINRNGNLTLGTNNSTATSDWNLAPDRFGPKNVAGVLTLRASGNLVFFNALSDGFTSPAFNATLLNPNPLLPVNAQSWSYRLTAGADLSAADFRSVQPLSSLGSTSGSLQLGKNNVANLSDSNNTNNPAGNGTQTPLTSTALINRFQVIRTGSGNIDISTGRDVQLLNEFATIYTAGTKVADATLGGTFDVPVLDAVGGQTALGAVQENPEYPAQYSMAGGNVTLNAQGNIAHLTRNTAGALVADSGRQLPNNWLYRRGYVDPVTGNFGTLLLDGVTTTESTTWWVDYSNFFQSVGALGGGNVTMIAGNDISNVDGVVPTNARMPKTASNANQMVELGGGDLVVRAGHDIDAGIYYVERGKGTLAAGNSIHTNSTRSPSVTNLTGAIPLAPETWLPTTLFLGKGGFDVSARNDLLLGPVANTFLLPEGYSNTFWYKTYFSTYAPGDYVNATSLSGAVTLREGATLSSSSSGSAQSLLQIWLQKEQLLVGGTQPSGSFFQPWIRIDETNVTPFATVSALLPGTLRATAFSGDVNVVGRFSLSPSPTGTVELAAAGSLNGLQPNGTVKLNNVVTESWGTAKINLSDANPNAIPGITAPFAYQSVVGTTIGPARTTALGFLAFIDNLFNETGSTQGVSQTKQALHTQGLLHAGDLSPARLYARSGNISGLTFFSPKVTHVFAGQDITDIALYLQNTSEDDVSVVASGRDIVAFNANSALRVAARAPGNVVNFDSTTLAGDIQIGGPGTLEVLAGRNLDLGTGANNADGTGVGITSIGNARNPYLSFDGAGLIVGAGVRSSTGLAGSSLDFEDFLTKFLGNGQADKYLTELDLKGVSIDSLTEEQKATVALKVFYLVLRDAGRNFPLTGTYTTGFAAIDSLFGDSTAKGDISTRSRDIRTKSGGDISIFAPGGKLTLATSAIGSPLAPPGIITESGGNISIFTEGDVDIGISRIFTLRGGNEIIWSSNGNIAAGSSAKTVKSAPPTRVLIDPQSGDVTTDLAGLATGGGIGVLATVAGVPPGDVDLIAPNGTVDAGDAGIRVSGNLNIAAVAVLNASNISVGGSSAGVPAAPAVSAPNVAGITSASSASGASTAAATNMAQQNHTPAPQEDVPSVITVEVIGYGGGDDDQG